MIPTLSPIIKSLMVRKGLELVPTLIEKPNASVEITMQLVPNFSFYERQSRKHPLVLAAPQDYSHNNFGELHVLTQLA
jgi:hypothetical protein